MTEITTGKAGPQATYEAYLAAGRFMIQRADSTVEAEGCQRCSPRERGCD